MFTYANSMSQLSITSKCGMLPLAAALMILAAALAFPVAAQNFFRQALSDHRDPLVVRQRIRAADAAIDQIGEWKLVMLKLHIAG